MYSVTCARYSIALAGARIAQLGGLELVLRIARAQAQLEPAVGQVVQRLHVARQQCRLVEAGVEHERPHPQRLGRRGGRHQRRERCGRPDVVGQVQNVEAEVLGSTRLVLYRRQ